MVVLRSSFFSVAGMALLPALLAQTPAPAPAGWARTTSPSENVPPATPESRPKLSPEMRGDIMMARKMFREAVETYSQGPKDSAILANKTGIAYHQMADLDRARKAYERAIKLNPGYAEAINNLGTVHYAKKSYRRATQQYQKALKLTPQSASIHSNLGTAFFARKKYKEAMESYERALALDPEIFEHRSTHGTLLQERNVEERAKFHFYLAKTYAKSGQVERALIYMRKCLEEGFRDKDKFLEEPEFAALRENQEFQDLLKSSPRVL